MDSRNLESNSIVKMFNFGSVPQMTPGKGCELNFGVRSEDKLSNSIDDQDMSKSGGQFDNEFNERMK